MKFTGCFVYMVLEKDREKNQSKTFLNFINFIQIKSQSQMFKEVSS